MEIAIVILGAVIVGQAVERYLYAKEMNKQNHNYMVALMTRDTKEYIDVKATEEAIKKPVVVPDEISMEHATEEEFDQHITSITQKP